jgi:hypothetical protein
MTNKMFDCDGTQITSGDVVRWKNHDTFDDPKKIGIVRYKSGNFIKIETFTEIWPGNSSIGKWPFNVRKMSDEEAMLWKLENL